MKILDTIFQSEYFANKPPVLMDIGASGEINAKWKKLARYATCIAFDADDREFQITEEVNKTYRKLITVNRIVTEEEGVGQTNFYLTASPYCSSLLEPDLEKLRPWLFQPLFAVEKIAKLPAVSLRQAMHESGITYIDWFKSDTQGTDLRLYKSLPEEIKETIAALEFEPGIIDAYKGEDKLYTVMQEMHERNFWLSSIKVMGAQRIQPEYANQVGNFLVKRAIRKTPGWAEVTYLRQSPTASERQILILYTFALIEKQYGFALEILEFALSHFKDPIFQDCKKAVWRRIKFEKMSTPFVILKRQLNKVFSKFND